MIVFVYDGTFEGLLTSVHDAYYRTDCKPGRLVPAAGLQQSLLEDYHYIKTDTDKAQKVYIAVKKLSPEALENIYTVFLSNDSQAGTVVYEYLKLGFRVGAGFIEMLADDRVLKVDNIVKRVMLEKHRFLGFVRFRLLEGDIYYSSIEPDNNILELIAPHFTDRLSLQNWIIHDTKRGLAAVYNSKDWFITDFDDVDIPSIDNVQNIYEDLWKAFYKNISIASRFNPRLQRNLMPKRYWKNITEKW